MTQNDRTGSAPAGLPGFLAYLPPAWLAVAMLLSLKSLLSAFTVTGESGLPQRVMLFIYGSAAADVVAVLWGVYVLSLAYSRSQRFSRHFAAWQATSIAWLVVREAYVLITPEFLFSPSSLAWTVGEIAIGAFCIYLVRRDPLAPSVYARDPNASTSLLAQAIAAVLGVIGGAIVGFGAGLLVGSIIVELADISCFEGACGYFAFFVGLIGLLAGAIAGGILAVWLTNRKRRSRPAAR